MKLHNKSARPHWVGDVMIAPLATETVGDEWRDAYNKKDLEEVTEEATDTETQPRRTRAKKEI